MINKKQTFHTSSDILSQDIDSETIILDMKSENYFGLNNVGSDVLEILKSGADYETLLKTLQDRYDVEPASLEKDITELLQQLLDAGIIQPAQ